MPHVLYDDRPCHECALVNWLVRREHEPDEDTGMWVVEPEFTGNGRRILQVIALETIARGAHLLPGVLPENFHFSSSLNAFKSYYVNSYVDHYAHELLNPLH
ncbi:hypothetical protein C8J56DRAFT_798914 [Mycena floridula]|nr:hypothetical protein C8J56DRAFT_798914 [Mycena floridula]